MESRPPIPRNVWVLGFVSLLMDLSSEIYHALLPAFITVVLGLPATARDAMVADETPPEIRGRAFGLRQALDTVGALLAPLVAIGLMWLLASNIRAVFWFAVIPAAASFLLAWLALREPEHHLAPAKKAP